MGSAPSRGRRQTFGSVLMKQFPNLSEFGSLCTTLTRGACEARISFDCFQILVEIQVNTVNTKWRFLSFCRYCFVIVGVYNVKCETILRSQDNNSTVCYVFSLYSQVY